MIDNLSHAERLDILTLAEPLACVMHAYRRLPASYIARNVTIFGGGPIGVLHAFQAQERFPLARIHIIEPNEIRRQLLAQLVPFIFLHHSHETTTKTDLAVVATSHPQASLTAIDITANAGTVILFSGLNHSQQGELPHYEGHDLEMIHRNEEVRTTSRHVRLVGSSGYHPYEINESIRQLIHKRGIYKVIQTGIVDALDGCTINGKDTGDAAVIKLLMDESVYARHLKVVIRFDSDEPTDCSIVASDSKGHVELRRFTTDAKVLPGMVRVRMLRTSICETDRRVLQGTKSSRLSNGLILGHEGFGMVKAIGPSVPRSLLNATCIVLPHYFEGEDELEMRGMGYVSRNMQHLGIHVNGVFTTSADLPLKCIYPIDEFIPQLDMCNSDNAVGLSHLGRLGQPAERGKASV